MPKDFDKKRDERRNRDRAFRIGGQDFVAVVGVRPEALAAYADMDENTPNDEALQILDELILEFIEDVDGAHERFRALRAGTNDPLTLVDLQDLMEWLMEAVNARPPTPSLASTPGLGKQRTGTFSTVESPLRAVETSKS